MRMRLTGVLVAAIVVASVVHPVAVVAQAPAKKPTGSAPAPKSKLGKPYSLSTGQFMALVVPSVINNFRLTELPVLAAYDPVDDKLGILLFGTEATMDAGRQVLDVFQDRALGPICELVKTTHGLALNRDDFYLAYYDLNTEKLVVEWVNGEYKFR